MPERFSAYRIDLDDREIRRVDLDKLANRESKENGVKVTHIEGEVNDSQEPEDGIHFLVESDFQNQYPLPKVKEVSLPGRAPRFKFKLMDLVYNDGKYPEVETLAVYDSRIIGAYMAPVNLSGNPMPLSKN